LSALGSAEAIPGPGPLWRHCGFYVARVALTALMLLLGPVVARGKYRVPREGGLLILANHLSDVDPVVVQLGCPRQIRFMGKSELFQMRVLGPILRFVGAFPVKRGEPDRDALKKAMNLIKAGEAVCIYPEGQLSEDGELQELKPGIALIAKMTGAPVICCGLQGSNRVVPYGDLIPRPSFHKIHVAWGEPRTFDKSAESGEIVAWATGQLRELIG
jgi:1-acyl-sn-glycerol-3-phosphate acyltransferase